MTTTPASTQEPDASSAISIGELSRRTGVSPATLRMWETRHGFPTPIRLDSGHRRYDPGNVAGVRLDVAIAEAMAAAEPGTPSVFAELRRRHPHLVAQRLRKSTLLALSWAIEDEFCARAQRARLFAGFQHERFLRAAEARWVELAKVAGTTMVFAEGGSTAPAT